MFRIDNKLIDQVVANAKESPRLRMNYNFHPELTDPVQRLINALEPWTYIRPHKHTTKEESFVLLRGTVLDRTYKSGDSIEAADIENLAPAAFEKKVAKALREGTAGEGRGFVLHPSACPYGRTITPQCMANYETMVRLAQA